MSQQIREDQSVIDAVKTLIAFAGEDPARAGLIKTPDRVKRYYQEIFSGYQMPLEPIFASRFASDGYDQMVVIKSIEFVSNCEHHLLPFSGTVDLAYWPHQHVLGLSKFARVVEVFCKRMQMQERMTQQIQEAITHYLAPKGVAVRVRATHSCMAIRGVKQAHAETTTQSFSGCFIEREHRDAFFHAIDS